MIATRQNPPESPRADKIYETQLNGAKRGAVHVWLVDDDDEFRGLMAQLLARANGIECSRDFSSPNAVISALASRTGPDVILLDVQMRDQNGLDAIRPIKSLARSTRVMMFTTFNDPAGRSRARQAGASGYLLKTEALDRIVKCILAPDEPATDPDLVSSSALRLNAPAEKLAAGKPSRISTVRRSWFSQKHRTRPAANGNSSSSLLRGFKLFRRLVG